MSRYRDVAVLLSIVFFASCSDEKEGQENPPGIPQDPQYTEASQSPGESTSVASEQTNAGVTDIVSAEIPVTSSKPAFHYTDAESAATYEVFEELGDLYIDPREVREQNSPAAPPQIFEAGANVLPWAGYWYPKRGREIFAGPTSPLAKLDQYLNHGSVPSRIADWEEQNYDSNAAEWEGLCDSWAAAAVTTFEPKSAKRLSEIDFSVSDQKAIATKYFEGYRPKIYGLRYMGIASTDGQMQDLRPEAFHRIVEEYLGRRHQPIVIDEDPGPEIWSKPLFRMAYTMTYEGPMAIRVKAYPWMIRQRSVVDDAPTDLANDLAAPAYDYRLYYKQIEDGRLLIIGGEWIGSSLDFHPDMVFITQSSENSDQINPEVKAYNGEIRNFLIKAGLLASGY